MKIHILKVGSGEGELLVTMPMKANDEGLYPTMAHATWNFPGNTPHDERLEPFTKSSI